ncbi:MAG: cytochrome C oxidase subunit IV family protein [Nitrososphaerota archaeon]|nr:cytochrome C oxidase subunit IV family protein [Candidatus Calditenuaceae archaeon]MDW8073715.1 cytochrome C oxidase subunit IV family protein [Nitrososphaerota archaeon]
MRLWVYLSVFAALVLMTVLELIIFGQPLPRVVVDLSIIGLAGGKAVLIALFFQHLAYEPRSLSAFALLGIGSVIAFLFLSVYSIIELRFG